MRIAVDGTAASGKGTLARRLAKALTLVHLDTGSLYRGVGLNLMRDGFTTETVTLQDAENAANNLDLSLSDDPEIRTDAAGTMASVIAVMQPVREALKRRQQRFAHDIPDGFKGAVLDGRDIGTVILPDADCKFFVDADPEIRARRRLDELLSQGIKTDFDTVYGDLVARDERDIKRTIAPLRKTEDAIFVDTGAKTVEEMVTFALAAINR